MGVYLYSILLLHFIYSIFQKARSVNVLSGITISNIFSNEFFDNMYEERTLYKNPNK